MENWCNGEMENWRIGVLHLLIELLEVGSVL